MNSLVLKVLKQREVHLQRKLGRVQKHIKELESTPDEEPIESRTSGVHHSAKGTAKMRKVANEFHEGKLKDSHGNKVTNPKQMEAIAESERREHGYK